MIRIAATNDDIARCFPVMAQLRPHLTPDEFLARVRRQMEAGYRLALIEENGSVNSVGGYRILENLAWGRFLYVDDLVTDEAARSQGHGKALLAWLTERARQEGCAQLHLDSGHHRKDAHRFYLREGMDLASYHFLRKLGDDRD